MTHDDLDSWLRDYGAAWEARDGELAAALFVEDGVYCWGPYETPLQGREAIRDRWSRATGDQREVAFRHEILGSDRARGFARWWSTFVDNSTGSRVELDGVFVLDFDDDGLCTRLQEWWLARETRHGDREIAPRRVSERNVEVVRAMYRAFATRDQATLLSHVDPAMKVYDRPQHPDASVYEGRDGFLRFAQTDWEAFDEVTYEPQDFVATGPYVVVPIKQAGRGKGSALGIEETIVNVWKLREGMCVELRNYSTIREALEAVEHGQ